MGQTSRGSRSVAPGRSLLRANHLKEAILCPSPDSGNKALQAITGTVHHLCAGCIHPDIVPHLCGVILLASHKKEGGHRPIAVGEILWHLVSKCLTRCILMNALQVLTPLQVGVRGGYNNNNNNT